MKTQMAYRREVKRLLDYDDLPILIKEAWEKSFTAKNIRSGFKTCGIFPMNKEWVKMPENKEKLKITSCFQNDLSKQEKYDLMIKSYDVDASLKSLDFLNLSVKPNNISEGNSENGTNQKFLDRLNRFI